MTPWFLGSGVNSQKFFNGGWSLPGLIIPLAVWSAIWTGLALWHAARREEKGWFIFFLLVHTAGVAEILYLVFVAKAFVQKKPRRTSKRK